MATGLSLLLLGKSSGILTVLAAVFFVSYGRNAEGLPVISFISEDQEVDPGMTAVLRCRVDPWPNDFPVMWRKAGGAEHDLPISIGSTVIIRDPKYELWHTSNQYELHIRNAEASDSGEYLCHVYLGIQNYISSRTRLQVRRPPLVLDESSSSDSIMEGSAGKLECYAEGVPEPRITWLRDDGSIMPSGEPETNGNLLLIHAAQTRDQGIYLCVAENMLGRDVRKINLSITANDALSLPVMCTPECMNGGQCIGANTCQCLKGFTGPVCEKRSSKCNPAAFSPLTILGVELSSGVECQVGSHWRQDCNWCRCVKGRPHCARRTCSQEMNTEFANEPECESGSNWRNSCNWCSCCDSKAVCTKKRCPTAPRGDICLLPAIQPGTPRCRGFTRMWTYKSMLERCQHVVYRGCGATANLFSTREECRQRCVLTSPHTPHVNP